MSEMYRLAVSTANNAEGESIYLEGGVGLIVADLYKLWSA